MRSLGVIGLGLIGGSFARALSQTGARVIGFDLCPQTTDMAAKAGIIEKAASPQEACLADDIFIAVPVGSFGQVLDQIADCISPTSVIFDGGSCKQNAVAAAAKLGAKRRRFVPSHPIAGREDSGFAASSADLFRGQWTVICTTDADEDAVQATRSIWQKTGAKIAEISAAEHDEIFAAVSHLPHFLSFALVESHARPPRLRALFALCGGRFSRFHPHRRIAPRDVARYLLGQRRCPAHLFVRFSAGIGFIGRSGQNKRCGMFARQIFRCPPFAARFGRQTYNNELTL